uniref:AGBL carboxypeptidase 4 n=1 Tax=Hucho hucho TaxID=62062 RepID=A0A4W5JTG4_9TELE
MKTTKQIVVVGLEPILTLWLRNLTVEASGNHPTPSHLSLSLHCVAVATLSQRCALVCCAKMERKMEENMRDVDTGSEAGGEDALVGNVNKLMVTPTGYTGVPRKGHLVFDACFESGNLGRVDYISEFEFDLFIRPDTCNPRFRVWFNFTVENVRETQETDWKKQHGANILLNTLLLRDCASASQVHSVTAAEQAECPAQPSLVSTQGSHMAWTQLYCQSSRVGREEGESVLGIVWAAAGPLKPGAASCFITVLSNSLITAGSSVKGPQLVKNRAVC